MNTRKCTFFIFYLPLFAASVSQATELGVNYNGLTRHFDSQDVSRTGAAWVRAFLDVTKIMRTGEDIEKNPDVAGILKMREAGFKIVLSLKYDYSDKVTSDRLPADVDNAEFKQIRAFTTRVLDVIYPKVDIIVAGNEPFIESHKDNRGDNLFKFYKEITNHVITYNKERRHIPIYVGAFNNLNQPFMQHSESAQGLIHYARYTPGIAGVDLHMHTNSLADMENAINWTRIHLGHEKSIITTEFSLKNYFKSHLNDPVDARFATTYRIDPSWRIYQYLDFSLKSPRHRDEWVAFLKSNRWYMNVSLFLKEADKLFDSKGLTLATYGLRQTQASIGPQTDPWILNALYCNQTCVPNPTTGLPQFSYPWIESFRARK